jgi:hypothetical protein
VVYCSRAQTVLSTSHVPTHQADKRKQERTVEESQKFLKAWQRDGLTLDQALFISNYDHIFGETT